MEDLLSFETIGHNLVGCLICTLGVDVPTPYFVISVTRCDYEPQLFTPLRSKERDKSLKKTHCFHIKVLDMATNLVHDFKFNEWNSYKDIRVTRL